MSKDSIRRSKAGREYSAFGHPEGLVVGRVGAELDCELYSLPGGHRHCLVAGVHHWSSFTHNTLLAADPSHETGRNLQICFLVGALTQPELGSHAGASETNFHLIEIWAISGETVIN